MMDQESKFTRALEKAVSFRIEETGLLFLLDADGQAVLRFSKLEN
jgi:heat shock protein HslJ